MIDGLAEQKLERRAHGLGDRYWMSKPHGGWSLSVTGPHRECAANDQRRNRLQA
jgi:hypothetical protein